MINAIEVSLTAQLLDSNPLISLFHLNVAYSTVLNHTLRQL